MDEGAMIQPAIINICDPDEIECMVAPDGSSITFTPCGWNSHNPNDVAQRYCARCHRWMDLVELSRKLKAELF